MERQSAKAEALSSHFLVWGVILLCLGAFVFLILTGNVRLMPYVYPALALGTGFVLYALKPTFYVGFVWWLWFLTPCVRRIVDFEIGFTEMNVIMLTPFLVTAITFMTMLSYGKRLLERKYFPFLLVLSAIMYGYVMGVIQVGISSATYDLLNWAVPVLFAFHILMHWKIYPHLRNTLRRTFIWGVAVMGSYGIMQFIAPPAWDLYWMQNAQIGSIGRPEPYMVRVFSTLNAPGPFAMVMMAGLLVLFSSSTLLSRVAAVPGYVGFLLSLVRSVWGGWVLGLVFIAWRIRGHLRVRLVILIIVFGLLSLPVLTYGPIANRIDSRVQTVSDLEGDRSFRARSNLYETFSSAALTNPLGAGIGATGTAARMHTGEVWSLDSGVLLIPYVFGWPGTLMYIGALVLLLRRVIRTKESLTDQFAVVSAGIVCSIMALMIFANHLSGVKGVLVWCFMCMALAAQDYYKEIEELEPRRLEYA